MSTVQVTLSAGIAAIVNIDTLGVRELVPITFTGEADWTGTYEINVWDTAQKNNEVWDGSPTVADNVMVWEINPDDWKVPAGVYYYEIFNTVTERIEFKGTLKISI